MPKRYYFSSEDLTAADKLQAFEFAKHLQPDSKTIHFLIARKQDVKDHLEGVFSTVLLNKLASGHSIVVDGFTVSLESPTTFTSYQKYDVVVAIHVGDRTLNKLEKGEIAHLLVCNLDMDEPSEWIQLPHRRLSLDPATPESL